LLTDKQTNKNLQKHHLLGGGNYHLQRLKNSKVLMVPSDMREAPECRLLRSEATP